MSGNAFAGKVKPGSGPINFSEKELKDFHIYITQKLNGDKMKEYGLDGFSFNFSGEPFYANHYLVIGNYKRIFQWEAKGVNFPPEKGLCSAPSCKYFAKKNKIVWKGAKKKISRDITLSQLKLVFKDLGFYDGDLSTEKKETIKVASTKKEPSQTQEVVENYFCIWTGNGEYSENYFFTHSSQSQKFKKMYTKDCREQKMYWLTGDEPFFIVNQFEHKKLYKKLLWRYKHPPEDHPIKKLSSELFTLVENQVPNLTNKSKNELIVKKEPSQTQGIATKNEEIYFACLNVMVKDRSTIDNFQPGEEYGFQYFKLDSKKSKITVHEQIDDNKPKKIGSIKIDYQGKKTVEFDIREEEGGTIISDKFKLSSVGRFYKDDGYENYSFEATTYVKTKSDVLDYDFKSKMCLPPKNLKKEEKTYKKWISSGY